ncbi:MAG: glycosyltransferase family 4 protein [Anaerolineae bacterium]
MVYTVDGHGVVPDQGKAEVIWVFRRNRRQWLEEWRRGERSREFFYGLLSLRDRYRVGFVEDESRNPVLRPWYPIERLLARRIGMGFAMDIALRNLSALNRARVLISTVDACGLPLALLKRAGLLRSRLIYISQGLSDRVEKHGPDRWLARGYRRLLQAVEELVTLSPGARAGLATWLGIPEGRIRLLPFGIDHEFWRNTAPPGTPGGYIVSVGSDAGRDYATLLAVAGDLPLHIVTRLPLALAGRPTVIHTSEHSARELRDLYSGARFVVIPLHDRSQPSGQSAALQAMACEKAVIVTRTRGWWGEGVLRDGEHCVLLPPGDVAALRQAMQQLWADPRACTCMGERAREAVAAHFGEARMAAAVAEWIAAHA